MEHSSKARNRPADLFHSPSRLHPTFKFGKPKPEKPVAGTDPCFDVAYKHVLMDDSVIALLVLALVLIFISTLLCIKRWVTCGLC